MKYDTYIRNQKALDNLYKRKVFKKHCYHLDNTEGYYWDDYDTTYAYKNNTTANLLPKSKPKIIPINPPIISKPINPVITIIPTNQPQTSYTQSTISTSASTTSTTSTTPSPPFKLTQIKSSQHTIALKIVNLPPLLSNKYTQTSTHY